MDDVFDQVTEEAITVTSTGISRCRIAVDHVREMRNVAEILPGLVISQIRSTSGKYRQGPARRRSRGTVRALDALDNCADIACRTPHLASVAPREREFIWSGKGYRADPEESGALWGSQTDSAGITGVIAPAGCASVPLPAGLRKNCATVVLVPSELSADLRDHYSTALPGARSPMTVQVHAGTVNAGRSTLPH